MLNVEWRIAKRYMWGSRREGFLHVITGFSFLGICLGVATLIIVMSVMNGFRHELSHKTLQFNSHLTVMPQEELTYLDAQRFITQAQKRPGMDHIYAVVEGQAMLTHKKQSMGLMVKGLPKDDLMRKKIIADTISEGSLQDFLNDEDGLLVGIRLAESLNLRVGDEITLIAPNGNLTPFGMSPRFQSFKVSGVFNSGMYQYDKNVAFLPFETAQSFFKLDQKVSHLEIYLKDPYTADRHIAPLHLLMGERPMRFITWSKAHAAFLRL